MDVKEQVAALQPELVRLRRHFHENPERSWKEFQTQKSI